MGAQTHALGNQTKARPISFRCPGNMVLLLPCDATLTIFSLRGQGAPKGIRTFYTLPSRQGALLALPAKSTAEFGRNPRRGLAWGDLSSPTGTPTVVAAATASGPFPPPWGSPYGHSRGGELGSPLAPPGNLNGGLSESRWQLSSHGNSL